MDNMKISREKSNSSVFFNVKNMTTIAMMTAVICVLGPFSVPIGQVPISLLPLAVFLVVYIIGTVRGTIAYSIYLLLGFVGAPVFGGGTGGPSVVFGPTGGYLVAFIFMALLSGFFIHRFYKNVVIQGIGMFLGILLAYGVGTIWFMILMKCNLKVALTQCVFPFIPFDIVKVIVGIIVGRSVRRRLIAANVIED